MRLSNEAISGIKGNNHLQARLMTEFDVSWNTVNRWVGENKVDGELTRVRAVKILANELSMPEEKILTEKF